MLGSLVCWPDLIINSCLIDTFVAPNVVVGFRTDRYEIVGFSDDLLSVCFDS